MATYVTPSTWASGTIVTATFLNTQVKGNVEYLGTTHSHSTGTEGEGAGYIGPVSYVDGLGAAVPTAPTSATVSRIFATATSLGWQNSASATFYFGSTSHEHSISTVTVATRESDHLTPTSTGTNSGYADFRLQEIGTAPTGTLSTSLTVGGSGSRALHIYGGVYYLKISSFNSATVSILEDGISIKSKIGRTADGGSGGTYAGHRILTAGTVLLDAPSGSVTYSVVSQSSVSFLALMDRFLSVLEVRQS